MKKFFLLLAGCLFFAASHAQEPVTFTAEQDHQNMLDQLGIKSIRRGFDADEKSPFAANYDESKANPFPVIPEILRTNAGKKGQYLLNILLIVYIFPCSLPSPSFSLSLLYARH